MVNVHKILCTESSGNITELVVSENAVEHHFKGTWIPKTEYREIEGKKEGKKERCRWMRKEEGVSSEFISLDTADTITARNLCTTCVSVSLASSAYVDSRL